MVGDREADDPAADDDDARSVGPCAQGRGDGTIGRMLRPIARSPLLAVLPALLAGCGMRLTAYDALVRPGEEVEVRARVEADGPPLLSPEPEGVAVVLTGPGGVEVERLTDDDGWAVFPLRAPTEAGDHPCPVRLAGGGADPAALCLAVRPADEPVVVVDLDGTVTGAGPLAVLAGRAEPLPGAAATLTALARGRTILYLTARDDWLLPETLAFLDAGGFPPGPVLVRRLTAGSLSAAAYKREVLGGLRSRFTGDWIGIGDRREDAEACIAHGIPAYVIGGEPDDLPLGAAAVADWAALARALGVR